MRKGSLAVARRYARALLDVATEQGSQDALRAELGQAAALMLEHADLREALGHPALAAERKQALAQTIFEKAGAGALCQRLIALLIARGRVLLLPQIQEAYASLHNAQRKVLAAEAVSAVALAASEQADLAGALGRLAGQHVELTSRVDPAVLGGLLVRMGGRVYDGTVRTRLGALKDRLAGATHT